MSTVKWSGLGTLGDNIAGTALNSLADAATSAFITYDNSGNKDLYALVLLELASMTPLTGAAVVLRAYPTVGGVTPDNVIGGEAEVQSRSLTTTTGAKIAIFKIGLIGPVSLRLSITNNAKAAFAASGHSLRVVTFNEDAT